MSTTGNTSTLLFERLVRLSDIRPDAFVVAAWHASATDPHKHAVRYRLLNGGHVPASLYPQIAASDLDDDCIAEFLQRPDVTAEQRGTVLANITRAATWEKILSNSQTSAELAQTAADGRLTKDAALSLTRFHLPKLRPGQVPAVLAKAKRVEVWSLDDDSFTSMFVPTRRWAHELLALRPFPPAMLIPLAGYAVDVTLLAAAARDVIASTDYFQNLFGSAPGTTTPSVVIEDTEHLAWLMTCVLAGRGNHPAVQALAEHVAGRLATAHPTRRAAPGTYNPRPSQTAPRALRPDPETTSSGSDRDALSPRESAHALALSADPDALTRATAAVTEMSTPAFERTAAVLLRNPALPAAGLRALLEQVRSRALTEALPRIEALDLLSRDPSNYDVLDVWTAAFPNAVLDRLGWEPLLHGGGFRDWFCRWVEEVRSDNPHLEARATAALLSGLRAGVDDDTLRLVPAHIVLGEDGRRGFSREDRVTLTEQTLRVLTATLGADPARWATFQQVCDNSPQEPIGTLLDLVEAILTPVPAT